MGGEAASTAVFGSAGEWGGAAVGDQGAMRRRTQTEEAGRKGVKPMDSGKGEEVVLVEERADQVAPWSPEDSRT